jgi:hypothetical protein
MFERFGCRGSQRSGLIFRSSRAPDPARRHGPPARCRVSPKPEEMIDRFPVWKVIGDHPSRNAAPHDMEDSAENFALRVGAWSAASRHVCLRDDRSNDSPLRISQTAWITRHAEFFPDCGTKSLPDICLRSFVRQALECFTAAI